MPVVPVSNPATARNQAAKMRALGITGSRRVGTLPNVATFTEQGFEGFTLDSWIGFMAPARLPKAVMDKLVAVLRETTQLPAVRAKLLDTGFEPLGNTPEEFAAAQRSWAATAGSSRSVGCCRWSTTTSTSMWPGG